MAEAGNSFQITLKDHFDKRGLTFEDLKSHSCSKSVLVRLSKSLDNWEIAALYLELTLPEIKAIKVDYNNEEERRIKALNKWKEKNGDSATYYNLIEALNDSGRVDVIDQALDFLKDLILEKEEDEQQKEIERQKRRETKEKSSDSQKALEKQSKSSNPVEKQIPNTEISTSWQKMKFEQRRKNKPPVSSPSDLTPDNYQEHFYSALWFEEDEHITRLSKKCDGDYKLTIYDHKDVPPFLDRHPHLNVCYSYISGLSDDEIEYATQACDNITILRSDGSNHHLSVAFKHYYNFNHIENCLYVVASHSPELSEAMKNSTRVKGGTEISISARFTLKYSYFDHLHESVVKTPEHVRKCLLLPDAFSFGDLFLTFDPRHSSFDCIKLDDEHQLKALEMIVSESSSIGQPSPPVILYGPFGTGKTRILARAAFEIMMNGINKNKHARILISAHHEISITTFIFAYFGIMRKRFYLPFNVILITKQENKGVYADMYMTPDEFAMHSADICTMDHVIIIATYTMSLNLYQYLYSTDGFFTHLFLDEAAQVREPEAITPLALATKDAKIVLAGDMQQVGPNILVLGKEARMFGLHTSLLERLLTRYEEIGPVATRYITKLSVNYQSHNSLMHLPNLFYKNLELNTDKVLQNYSGPTGYNFVSVDSRIVDHPDKQWIEACVVLEEVRSYLERMKQFNFKFNPRHDVCIIASTRKQLNLIKNMAYMYKEYEAVRNVSFKPSFVIQGHEFQAIFLSLENDGMNIKSLFNPFVFNTVITRAKFYVVAIGFLEEVKQLELTTLFHPDRGSNTTQCWHEYLKLCEKQGTLRLFDISNPLLPYKISGINEKGKIPEIISLEELQGYTLSQDKVSDKNQNIILEKDKIIAKLTSQVEEQSQNEKQIITDLRAKVSDNEFYTTKLIKEKSQLQERVKSLEEQFIKETSSIGLQFDYLIPSMDNLDCLSDVQVAEKKLFLVQGEKPQLINWEKYGLRIGVQEDTLLPSDTVELAVVALVGGQFQFPPNTVLVSAVYALSLSKPLLKQLILEIQHCVDLTGRPTLSRYLKFAIAPVSTPSLPYQFSIVEGGEFKPDSWYGSIQRKEFCLVCILGEESTNGGGNGVPIASVNGDTEEGEDDDEEEQPQQEENEEEEEAEEQAMEELEYEEEEQEENQQQNEEGGQVGTDDDDDDDSDSSSDKTNSTAPCASGAKEPAKDDEKGKGKDDTKASGTAATMPLLVHSENVSTDDISDGPVNKALSTGVVEATSYAGILYYKEDGVQDLVTFTSAKKLNALLEFIKKEHSNSKIGQYVYFRFMPTRSCDDDSPYVELIFDTPQKKPTTGWTIEPHIEPCRFYQDDVDKFGKKDYSLPPSCLISVYGSFDAVPSLHYSVPLDGVVRPVTLFIHRSLRTTCPLPPPSTNPTTSSSTSNVVAAVSSTGGASASATVDVNKVKKVVDDKLVSHYDTLTSLTKSSLLSLANKLYTVGLISEGVKEKCTMEEFLGEFRASLKVMKKLPQIKDHCQKFLSSFIAVRGSYANTAKDLGEDWIEAIRNELGFDFNIDIDS